MTWGGCLQQGARLERWVGQAELLKRHFGAAPDAGRRLSEQRSPRAMSVGHPVDGDGRGALWSGWGARMQEGADRGSNIRSK